MKDQTATEKEIKNKTKIVGNRDGHEEDRDRRLIESQGLKRKVSLGSLRLPAAPSHHQPGITLIALKLIFK